MVLRSGLDRGRWLLRLLREELVEEAVGEEEYESREVGRRRRRPCLTTPDGERRHRRLLHRRVRERRQLVVSSWLVQQRPQQLMVGTWAAVRRSSLPEERIDLFKILLAKARGRSVVNVVSRYSFVCGTHFPILPSPPPHYPPHCHPRQNCPSAAVGAHTAQPSTPAPRELARRSAGTRPRWLAAPGRISRPSPSHGSYCSRTAAAASSSWRVGRPAGASRWRLRPKGIRLRHCWRRPSRRGWWCGVEGRGLGVECLWAVVVLVRPMLPMLLLVWCWWKGLWFRWAAKWLLCSRMKGPLWESLVSWASSGLLGDDGSVGIARLS